MSKVCATFFFFFKKTQYYGEGNNCLLHTMETIKGLQNPYLHTCTCVSRGKTLSPIY